MKVLHEAAWHALVQRLSPAIRRRRPGTTRAQVEKIAELWILRVIVVGAAIAGAFYGPVRERFVAYLRSKVSELDSDLVSVYESMGEIIDSDELWQLIVEVRSNTVIKTSETLRCSAEMVQWAVGQGGFWTTSGRYRRPDAAPPNRAFEIVFDCGSSTTGALGRALQQYRPANGTIDYLFLSHLDLDHTSGVEQLLSKFKVDTVVMPLLSPAATLLASARLAARGGPFDEQAKLLTDPGVYLRERGVRQILLLQSEPEGEGPETPAAPTPGEPPQARGELFPLGQEYPDFISSRPVPVASLDSFPHAQVLPHATTLWLTASDGRAFWQLSPYVHPFEPLRIGRFMQSAYRLLDATGGDVRASIKTLLTSANGRLDLKRLYRLVRSDHNAVSMSLFSSPLESNGAGQMWLNLPPRKGGLCLMQPPAPRFGWMHTGDSTLGRESYRRAWFAYYRQAFEHVGILVVPHHGSRHNFHRDLFSIPAPPLAIACAARTNSFGHPAAAVSRSAKAQGLAYHQVDERSASELVSVYWS